MLIIHIWGLIWKSLLMNKDATNIIIQGLSKRHIVEIIQLISDCLLSTQFKFPLSFHGLIAHLFFRWQYSIVWIHCSLSIHLMNILAFLRFWQVWVSCYKHSCAGFCKDISFQYLWANAKEDDCWFIRWCLILQETTKQSF